MSKVRSAFAYSPVTSLVGIALLLALLAGCTRGGGGEGGIGKPLDQRMGETVDDVVLTGIDGEPRSIMQVIDGRVALVDIWATWCAPCIMAMPHLQALHNRFSDQGFTVVGVMTDANATRIGPDYVAKKPVSYPMLLDDGGDRFVDAWGTVGGIPMMVLVDREGTIVEVFRGVGDLNIIDESVAAVLARDEAPAEDPAEAAPSETARALVGGPRPGV